MLNLEKHTKYLNFDIVYHGTSSHEGYLSLTNIDKIDLKKGSEKADFGQGFYVTSVLEQAQDLARKRANMNNQFIKNILKTVGLEISTDIET